MKLIIAGSRDITDYSRLLAAIDKYELAPQITEIVCGCARGVDMLGERYANEHNIPIKYFPADWDRFGRSAGYHRNCMMAEYADGLLALWDGVSKGTKHMINIAQQYSLRVWTH